MEKDYDQIYTPPKKLEPKFCNTCGKDITYIPVSLNCESCRNKLERERLGYKEYYKRKIKTVVGVLITIIILAILYLGQW